MRVFVKQPGLAIVDFERINCPAHIVLYQPLREWEGEKSHWEFAVIRSPEEPAYECLAEPPVSGNSQGRFENGPGRIRLLEPPYSAWGGIGRRNLRTISVIRMQEPPTRSEACAPKRSATMPAWRFPTGTSPSHASA